MHNIENYAAYIRDHYTSSGSPKDSNLLISRDGDLETYYSPFDHVNTQAKMVLIGITPGDTQAHLANLKTSEMLRAGHPPEEAIRVAKSHASFGGAMRNNLVAMLDCVGLNRKWGIASCSEAFDTENPLLHFTSALMYPVFREGKNYSGTPKITGTQYLLNQALSQLEYQLRKLREDVLWLPLGPAPTDFLKHAARLGLVNAEKILDGLPHPSGANAERIAVFLGRKRPDDASVKTNPAKLLAARSRLEELVTA